MARFLDDWTTHFDGLAQTANRRISNIEPQKYEGWNRFVLSFLINLAVSQVSGGSETRNLVELRR